MYPAFQTFLVLGLSRSGRSGAEFLLKKGATVYVYDDLQNDRIEQTAKQLEEQGAKRVKKDDLFKTAEFCDALVLSPGIPIDHALAVAFKRSGKAVLGEMELASRYLRGTVIAVTGTNGKTTTAYMLRSILKEAGKRVGIIGTLGAFFEEHEWQFGLTTPDPIQLQSVLASMQRLGAEYVVMEASAHALYYEKLSGIRFSACIFTNLSQDHLDFFKTMSAYKSAKLKLFEDCPIAVLNGDDETGRSISRLREREGGKTVLYGLHTPTDAFAVITREGLNGTECMLNVNDKLCKVRLSLVGRHNVYNALASATCAVELGLDVGAVASGLKKLKRVKGRLERVAQYHGADVYVDFAHTPDGLEKSLEALRQHTKGRLVCLFGCGGNRDREKRALMGEIASKKSDFSVLTSDNPRYEDPLDIISEIEKGYRRFGCRYVVVPDRARAIEYALDFLVQGDVLLIAGKGGEDTQEIMGIKYPFDDQTVVEKLTSSQKDGV